jgi:hypothetical protein
MSLVGPRPKNVYQLPARKAAPLRPGICPECLAPLKTSTDVALHYGCEGEIARERALQAARLLYRRRNAG